MSTGDTRYYPQPIHPPPLFGWPPKMIATVKWLVIDLLWPWSFLWFGLAVLIWNYQMPEMSQMQQLEPGWITGIWLRNAIVLTTVAGGLHWWFYIKKGQKTDTKFTQKWFAKNDSQFLWGDQVKDNMFWSLLSGVTIWSGFEALTWWWYANGYVSYPTFSDAPLYFIVLIWGVLFWSTFHFLL